MTAAAHGRKLTQPLVGLWHASMMCETRQSMRPTFEVGGFEKGLMGGESVWVVCARCALGAYE